MKETRYFNIDSVVGNQVAYLPKVKSVLTKQVLFNGKEDSAVIAPKDSVAWATELDVFRQLDVINKPINKGLYSVVDERDTKSNLMIRSFTSTNEELAVQILKIYYHNSIANLRKIEGLYLEKNYLYTSTINLSMEFDNLYNKITLTNYTIEGSQKMFLGDSVNFTIAGRVKIN
ncbi:MAG TPA: hypothetical protein VIM65_21275 [Cyclobacteriaceae bacterium]